MQITSAMKMVAANCVVRMRHPHASVRWGAQAVLSNVSASLDSGEESTPRSDEKRVLLVAITSNRGLCGGFNNNIIKQVNNATAGDAEYHVLPLGKKANDAFKKDVSLAPQGR